MKIFLKLLPKASFLFLICNLLVLKSCEKEKEAISVTNDPTKQEAVVILNNGSGFDSVLNITSNLQGVGTIIGNLGLYDFTVESNSNLNFAWYSWFPTQQSNLYTNTRSTYNINSKSYVPLPTEANTIIPNYSSQDPNVGYTYFFKPYKNFFNYCSSRSYTGGLLSAAFNGDVSAIIPQRYTVLGEADMGYLFPMLNSVRFPGNIDYDARVGCLTQGVLAPSSLSLYILKTCNPFPFTYQYSTNSAIPKIVANFFDISIINKGLSQSKYEDISYAFDLRSDSFLVHHIIDTTSVQTGYVSQNLIKLTGIGVEPGLNNNSIIKKIRHYSADGKIFGMFFQDITTKKCWTFSFDYTTHTFTKGLQNADLNYSAEGSDIDIDEMGNVYYSGIAGNGSNTTGVSVYRKDISGAVALVGTDNFLKFGEIIQLKYLFGKIYMAVTGTISGTYYKQLTFLKQQ